MNQAVMPFGITLLCVSLVIYKVLGNTINAANFFSGVLAGIAMVLIGAYLFAAFQTGAPIDMNQ